MRQGRILKLLLRLVRAIALPGGDDDLAAGHRGAEGVIELPNSFGL